MTWPPGRNAKGASLDDTSGVFNASQGAGTHVAVDLHDGDVLDEGVFVGLARRTFASNRS